MHGGMLLFNPNPAVDIAVVGGTFGGTECVNEMRDWNAMFCPDCRRIFKNPPGE